MDTTGKPLTRDALISMQVIDGQGRLVGKVKDVIFAVGKSGVSLSVENDAGESRIVSWDEVQAAADFIILRPQAQAYQPPQQQTGQPICPMCQKPLTWIPQYQRWYCYNDKKYV